LPSRAFNTKSGASLPTSEGGAAAMEDIAIIVARTRIPLNRKPTP